MTTQGKKQLKWILLSLLIACYVAQWIVSAVRFIHERQARQLAEAWLHEAQQGATSDMNKADAMRWLRQHGADRVYVAEKSTVNGKEIDWCVVAGFRKMTEDNFWTRATTADLQFHFDNQWHFKEVKLAMMRYSFY